MGESARVPAALRYVSELWLSCRAATPGDLRSGSCSTTGSLDLFGALRRTCRLRTARFHRFVHFFASALHNSPRSIFSYPNRRAVSRTNLSYFVLHSLSHTFGTRLGDAGADALTIMRLMGHSEVTVSHRCVHPSPEAIAPGYERLTAMNLQRLPTKSPTVPQSGSAHVS